MRFVNLLKFIFQYNLGDEEYVFLELITFSVSIVVLAFTVAVFLLSQTL